MDLTFMRRAQTMHLRTPASVTAVSDIGIAERCRTVIQRLGPFPNVTVSVSQGWVSLSGRVGRASDRWKVEHAVGLLKELAGVSAQIKVDDKAGTGP